MFAYVRGTIVFNISDDPTIGATPGYDVIRFDPDITECQLWWVWDGAGFHPPHSPVPEVPTSISPRQCRLQLLSESLLDEVEAAISTMPQAAQIEWGYALEIKRDYGLVTAMQQLLGKDDAEMDTFFTEAYKL